MILNTHLGLSEKERKGQLKVIGQYLKSLKPPIILMGDFNTTDPDIDDLYLVDAAKTMKKEYLETLMNSGKRIDYIFISESIQILDYKVIPIKLSDHYPVILEVLI